MFADFMYIRQNSEHEAKMPRESSRDPDPKFSTSTGASSGLPPYFGLSPDQAMSLLGPAMGTADLARIAELAGKGRDDLAARGLGEEGRKSLRQFSTWEITRYLIPVAQGHFRRVLKANPDLPQGRSETDGGA